MKTPVYPETTHQWLAVAIALLVPVGVSIAIWVNVRKAPAPQELYSGKPLDSWLLDLARDPSNEQARRVILAAGQKAVPCLVQALAYRPQRRPASTAGQQRPLRDEGFERWNGLSYAFQLLGPSGRGALPEITKLLDDPGAAGQKAGQILPYVARMPEILQMVTNRSQTARAHCLGALMVFPDLRPALPALLSCLDETNGATVRIFATVALGQLVAKSPAESAPVQDATNALVRLLADSNPEVRRFASNMLTNIENDGRTSHGPGL